MEALKKISPNTFNKIDFRKKEIFSPKKFLLKKMFGQKMILAIDTKATYKKFKKGFPNN